MATGNWLAVIVGPATLSSAAEAPVTLAPTPAQPPSGVVSVNLTTPVMAKTPTTPVSPPALFPHTAEPATQETPDTVEVPLIPVLQTVTAARHQ